MRFEPSDIFKSNRYRTRVILWKILGLKEAVNAVVWSAFAQMKSPWYDKVDLRCLLYVCCSITVHAFTGSPINPFPVSVYHLCALGRRPGTVQTNASSGLVVCLLSFSTGRRSPFFANHAVRCNL